MLSYAAFARRVTHAAAGLRRYGLRYGDRVLVNLPLGAALPVAVHAVAWAGGVAVLGELRRGPDDDHPSGCDTAAADVRHVFAVGRRRARFRSASCWATARWSSGRWRGPR